MQNHELQTATDHLVKQDKVLSTIIKNIGIINLTPRTQYFNPLLRAIIGQQLSVHAASTIHKRFMDHFNNKPHPELILSTEDLTLRSLGLSNAKVKYVKDFSQKILSKEIRLEGLSKKSDEEIIEELTKVKGIGVWTVHMFLIFTLGRPNVLPFSDLGIRKAIMLNYGLRKLPDEKKVVRIAKKNNWHPHCSVASLYLWRSLEF
ncbi:MAG: DNA-3-methyladenine glycosylase 2 family protein [Bacteroidetes bacterium]|nr:DNA-3-methyladenine glycosylase 2 family protein [Bacteroidota bacterium]MCL6098943.1 DNA-3-methyladenine glycosylase 2 family protein [Bacteroidota bacterium]